MESLSWGLQQMAKRLIDTLGGSENISSIASGKKSLLYVTVKHLNYVSKTQLLQAPFIEEVLIGNNGISMKLNGVSAADLELALKLYDSGVGTVFLSQFEDSAIGMDRIFRYLRKVFTPLLSILIAGGVLQVLIVLMIQLNIFTQFVAVDSLFPTISGLVYFLLPVMIAFSSARHLLTNPYVAVCIAGILIHPQTSIFITDTVLESFLGFQLFSEAQSNSIIPILFLVPIQAYLDRILEQKLLPSLQSILKPFFLLITGLFLGIFLFSPIMTLTGNAVVALLDYLVGTQPWLVTTLVAAFGPLMVTLGAHYSLFPLINSAIETNGFESILGPGLLIMNMAHVGVALAIILKSNKKIYRHYSISACIMALLGVSQPVLYGIEVPLKRPLLYAMIGGGVGGMLAGLLDVRAFQVVNPNITTLTAFHDGSSNIWMTLLCMLVSFFIAFYLIWRADLLDLSDEEIQLATNGIQQVSDQADKTM